MVSTLLLAVGALAAWTAYRYVSALWHNVVVARKTGLPYAVYPIHPHNWFWQFTSALWIPLIELLPRAWWEKRLIVMRPNWAYRTNQAFYEWIGGETFLVVSPENVTLFTENAELISQMTMRREAFPKDIARYGLLTMFGHNVVTTEGAVWRMHRKVTASSFNERNAAHTFNEAITQTQGLLRYYFGSEPDSSRDSTDTIRTLEHDTMRWALNIIGYVGFGLRLIWPGQPLSDDVLAKYGSLEPPAGYAMTFAESLGGMLESVIILLLIPERWLRRLPFQFAKHAQSAKDNYLRYMKEFLQIKRDEIRKGSRERVGMDIMGELVRSTYGDDDAAAGEKASSSSSSSGGVAKLTDDEIISNAFIMTLAGHETTANIIHFTLIELATNPAAQQRLQHDVDALFGDSDPSTWNYEQSVNPLLASYVGASINETMRLIPPVTDIPKVVSPRADQNVTIDGRRYVLPRGVPINIMAPSVARNPRYWPTRPSAETDKATDLEDWLPERWYRDIDQAAKDEDDPDLADYGGFQGRDTSASLYRPVRGSFVPFSDGPRACLGRRIAVVEMIAALATIFQRYSVELAVDEWATDDKVATMSLDQKRALYKLAQDKSRAEVQNASSIITLKLRGDQHVPVRFVRRGRERFVGVV